MQVHSHLLHDQLTQIGKGKAFGTFGELLQGRLGGASSDFLVTLPIQEYSNVTFITSPTASTLTVYPSFKEKSLHLARMLLEFFSLPCKGALLIDSDLPVGKGLASSSADLVATARALTSCFRLDLPVPLLQRFMREIEPSDGVMYPGVVSFYHCEVRLCEFIGVLPSLTIVGIDEGGELDTLEFNRWAKPYTSSDEQEYRVLLRTITHAIQRRDVRTIGKVATRSAILNQRLNPKRTLSDLIKICREIDALGVVVAHSGTCIGILLSDFCQNYDQQVKAACAYMADLAETVFFYHSLDFA